MTRYFVKVTAFDVKSFGLTSTVRSSVAPAKPNPVVQDVVAPTATELACGKEDTLCSVSSMDWPAWPAAVAVKDRSAGVSGRSPPDPSSHESREPRRG